MLIKRINPSVLWVHLIGLSFLLLISYPTRAEQDGQENGKRLGNYQQTRFERLERYYFALENLLQLFYKIDGNLPKLNSSKVKRLKHLEAKLSEGNLKDTDEVREFFGDADGYIYRMGETTRTAIKSLEDFTKVHSAESDEKLVQAFLEAIGPGRKEAVIQANPFKLLQELMDLQDAIDEAFNDQSDCLDYLVSIQAADRISATGIRHEEDYYFETGLMKPIVRRLIGHHVRTLGMASVFSKTFFF